MFVLLPDTHTLAVVCAFSTYDAPTETGPTCKQLQTLEQVEPTVQRLVDLFSTSQAKTAKIQVVYLLNRDDASLLSSLKEIRKALRERSDVNMLLFWSGHGSVPEGSFRMATRNSFDPIDYEDGLGLKEVMRQSGIARVRTWTMLLDACYAGEGLADVVKEAQDLLKSESGQLRGYGALCSSSPYEKARDSVFLSTVVSVLESGPSEATKAFAIQEGGGGTFNSNNRLLSVGELFEAVSNEYRADKAKYRGAQPWPILGGELNPRLFPNPQYQANQSSRLVEESYRSIARVSDLKSHFFPKALGIDNLESGWHFSGRVEATRSILRWMSTSQLMSKDRLYVLAADGGTGKSALLGRLIALSDRNYRKFAIEQGWSESEDIKAGTVPIADHIDAALSLRNLTPQTVAEYLANLLALGSFESVEGFVDMAAKTYKRKDGEVPCLVLDALDEATEPLPIVFRIIRPLVEAGWKLLVATRRSASARGAKDILADLGSSTVFELDQDQQSWSDIYTYSKGRLKLESRFEGLAEPAARLIADRADNKFLFARMAISSLLRRTDVISIEQLPSLIAKDATNALTLEVEALDQAFRFQFASDGNGVTAMFTALAWAEGDGVPVRDGIWAAMAEAVASLIGPSLRFEDRHIDWMLREAGRFIQESGDGEQAVYRLFHKSLVEHFQGSPFPRDPLLDALDERMAISLLAKVHASRDWAYANPYLVRHMPAHLASRPEQKGLNELLLNFDWIQARLNQNGIQALLSDYRLCHTAYPATARLHRTLSMIAHILRAQPDQLIPQLLGRIRPGVPDITPLLDGTPGANFGLQAQGPEKVANDMAHTLSQSLPGLTINLRSTRLDRETLRLDPLLDRAKASLRRPCWIPALGGLAEPGPLVFTLQGHHGWINSVALSSDGRTLASASSDRTVRLWDAQDGSLLRTLLGHEDAVNSVALSSDGRTLASASSDRTVRVWDAVTGQPLHTLQGHKDKVMSVALSADGRTLASAGSDRTVRVWDAETGQPLYTLQVHKDKVKSVALSADGRILASADADHTMYLWDAQTGQLLRTLQGNVGGNTSVALSADGRTLASCGQGCTVRIWDTQSGQTMRTLQGSDPWDIFHSVALSADGRTLSSSSQKHTVRIWDAQTGQPLHTLQGHEAMVICVALSADGQTLASAGHDHTLRLWDIQTSQPLRTMQDHDGLVTSVALSADGCILASSGEDHTVRVWDAQTGLSLRTLQGHERVVTSVAMSGDGRTLASASVDRTVRVWGVETGQPVHVLQGHESWVTSVALSADGRTLASSGEDRTVRVWDAQTGLPLHILQGHESWVTSVALSADGRTLASASLDHSVRVWDVETGQPLHVLRDHKDRVSSVALSSDGRTLASASRDCTVRLWDAQTGQPVLTLRENWVETRRVALSADGRILVAARNDRTVCLLDAASGCYLDTFDLDRVANALAWAERGDPPILVLAAGNTFVRFRRSSGYSSS